MIILPALGTALITYFLTDSLEVEPKPAGTVYYSAVLDSRHDSFSKMSLTSAVVKPLAESQFRGIVKQGYDYSCGSAALTTLLNGYIGRNQTEKETMDGMLKYGEYDKIVERRSFSMLDMKRYVNALGLNGNGFKGSFAELVEQQKPVIVPIEYAGFKHFVIFKGAKENRVYVADPALGNISFDQQRFIGVWKSSTMFIIEPSAGQQTSNMLDMTDADMRHVADSAILPPVAPSEEYQLTSARQARDVAATLQRVSQADKNALNYGAPIESSLRIYYRRK